MARCEERKDPLSLPAPDLELDREARPACHRENRERGGALAPCPWQAPAPSGPQRHVRLTTGPCTRVSREAPEVCPCWSRGHLHFKTETCFCRGRGGQGLGLGQ